MEFFNSSGLEGIKLNNDFNTNELHWHHLHFCQAKKSRELTFTAAVWDVINHDLQLVFETIPSKNV